MSSKKLSALILAGGLGIRMRPLTISIPKPLLPIGNKSILEDIITNLSKQNIKEIYIALNYKGEMIQSLIGSGKKYGVNINYLKEKEKLGTVGPIKLIKKSPNDLIVINGDIKTNLKFNLFYQWHKKINLNYQLQSKKLIFNMILVLLNTIKKIQFLIIKKNLNQVFMFQQVFIFSIKV